MAIYHNSASIIKRSAGKSSIAAAAYRSGNKLTDDRTGLTHDYSRKTGVYCSLILTPIAADWITDREKLWNRVEEVEKRFDSQLSREVTPPKISGQEAKERDSRFYEKIAPKEVTKLTPSPAKKWISFKQEADPQLVCLILQTADRLGADSYKAGNYQVRILAEQIEVKYGDELAMIVDIHECKSLLIDRAFTRKQYEVSLTRSIDALMTEIEQQREKVQVQAKELEQQLELEFSSEIIVDDSQISFDDSEIIIDDHKPLLNKNLSRKRLELE